MSNGAFDNSHNGAIANGTRDANLGRPAPTQQPGQTADSFNTQLNQYNFTLNQNKK